MRTMAVLGITFLISFTLGACGGEDSGTVPGDYSDPGPSSDVPAMVDTTGMTEAQLEAKLAELEKLHDAKMEEMSALSPRARDGAMDAETTRKIMQITADTRALREQMNACDDALDALSR